MGGWRYQASIAASRRDLTLSRPLVIKGGFLYMVVIHNQKKKPVYKRVKVST